MDRKEFVDLLSTALAGRVPTRLIREKVNYYRGYISEEADRTGVDEEEIICSLGTPESIAHTIVDTYERENGPYTGPMDETPLEEAADAASEAVSGLRGKVSGFFAGKGCMLGLVVAVFLLVAVGSWMVNLIATYPLFFIGLIIVIVVINKARSGGGGNH